jgi:photosystem II stability/assembly factor-like uncharacterized protein
VRVACGAAGAARALCALLPGLALLGAVCVTVAAPLALGGCGGSGAEAPAAEPFGPPPAAAPGVRAWAAGEVGTLLVTADGGAGWERQRFYLSERGVDVAFPDARTGWLVTDAGGALVTVDGGGSWEVVDKSKLQLKAVAAADASTAWIVAIAGSLGDPGNGVLLRTADGGATWERTPFGDAMLADVAFADARHGVVVALDRIWTSSDGGRSWKLRRRLGMTVLTSVFAGDARHAWVAGWDTQDGLPLVLASENGGSSWRRLSIDVPAPSPGALQAGQIVAAGEGTASAAGSAGQTSLWLTCAAGVLASRDGGETWELQRVPAGAPQAIAAADRQHVLATTTSQPVLATSDGGATWLAFGSDGFLKQPLVSIAAVSAPTGE